jgi:hypothetical protein
MTTEDSKKQILSTNTRSPENRSVPIAVEVVYGDNWTTATNESQRGALQALFKAAMLTAIPLGKSDSTKTEIVIESGFAA